jgi:hypothetical protein
MAEIKDIDVRTAEIPQGAEDDPKTTTNKSPEKEKPPVISSEALAAAAANEIFKAGQVGDVRRILDLEASSGPMASGALEKMHLDNAQELLAQAGRSEVQSVVDKTSGVTKTAKAIGAFFKRFIPGIK